MLAVTEVSRASHASACMDLGFFADYHRGSSGQARNELMPLEAEAYFITVLSCTPSSQARRTQELCRCS